MKAVVFSSYIPNLESLFVWKSFLEIFLNNFHDYDIYVWINYWSINQREDLLLEYTTKLNINYWYVDKNLAINSDASGFQKALEILKKQSKRYELIWFGHTKWSTSARHSIREMIIKDFFWNKSEIENLFEKNKKIGIYWTYITTSTNFYTIDHNLDKLNKYPYISANIFYLYTFYVISWEIIHDFLDTCDSSFFDKNLIEHHWFDRYFFERDFPNIPTRYGYNFWYKTITHHPFWNINYKSKIDLFSKRRFKDNIFHNIFLSLDKIIDLLLKIIYIILEKILSNRLIWKYKNKLLKIFYKV